MRTLDLMVTLSFGESFSPSKSFPPPSAGYFPSISRTNTLPIPSNLRKIQFAKIKSLHPSRYTLSTSNLEKRSERGDAPLFPPVRLERDAWSMTK